MHVLGTKISSIIHSVNQYSKHTFKAHFKAETPITIKLHLPQTIKLPTIHFRKLALNISVTPTNY